MGESISVHTTDKSHACEKKHGQEGFVSPIPVLSSYTTVTVFQL